MPIELSDPVVLAGVGFGIVVYGLVPITAIVYDFLKDFLANKA